MTVVITTSQTVANEYSLAEKGRGEETVMPHSRFEFYRVVLDEAQHIKNRKANASLGCLVLKAKHCVILPGTPVQNYIEEYVDQQVCNIYSC